MKMRTRKGQIRIGESMAVMIVFFFLLMFGYSFYINIQKQQFARDLKESSENIAVQVAQKIYFLPELQCSSGVRFVRESCYDQMKIEGFIKMMNGNSNLRELFYKEAIGISKIDFHQVYPRKKEIIDTTAFPGFVTPDDVNTSIPLYTIYDMTGLATNQSMDSYETFQMPIAMKNPISGEYKFGYLVVYSYYMSEES
ncbi:MAG: hypothetical protein V1740_06380 [Candidatus Woesearchaeota archaeon]